MTVQINSAEDILEMEAGLELDILVSELVVGSPIADKEWPCGYDYDSGEHRASREKPSKFPTLYDKPYPVIAEHYEYEEDGVIYQGFEHFPLNKYSTDITDASILLSLNWFLGYALIRNNKGYSIIKQGNLYGIAIDTNKSLALLIARVAVHLTFKAK